MTPDLLTLGKRAVAAGGWADGMAWLDAAGVSHRGHERAVVCDDGVVVYAELNGIDSGYGRLPTDAVPDLSDDATKGAVLGLVRAKHGEWAEIRHDLLGWFLWLPCDTGPQSAYRTEAEALVAALEAEVSRD